MFSFLKRPDDAPKPVDEAVQRTWRKRLKTGLSRTATTLNTPVTELFRRSIIDDALLEELEETLLMADCGLEATQFLLTELRSRLKRERIETPAQMQQVLTDILAEELAPL
ncbi:MAG: signal recognition particle receptor subunit alpha, partial [Rhodocyclaceae bacterium]